MPFLFTKHNIICKILHYKICNFFKDKLIIILTKKIVKYKKINKKNFA